MLKTSLNTINFKWNFKFIYKICTKSDWLEIKKKVNITGSKKDLRRWLHSFFRRRSSCKGTLKKFYQNQKDLVLLKVDALKLENLVMGTSI